MEKEKIGQKLGRNVMINLYDKKVTAHELSQAVGCSPSMISKIIIGEKIPSLELTVSIADYFSCTVDELLRGDKEDGRKENRKHI